MNKLINKLVIKINYANSQWHWEPHVSYSYNGRYIGLFSYDQDEEAYIEHDAQYEIIHKVDECDEYEVVKYIKSLYPDADEIFIEEENKIDRNWR